MIPSQSPENNYFLVKLAKPNCSNLQKNLMLFGLFSLLLLLQILSKITMTGCLTVLIQEKNHSNVTNVTKHSDGAVSSVSISVFILEKDHFNVTNVIEHSTRGVIL
jgi:hypothetical protein